MTWNINCVPQEKQKYAQNLKEKKDVLGVIGELSDTEQKNLINEVLTSINYNFIVTPKEIDFVIDKLSTIIGNGINKCLHDI